MHDLHDPVGVTDLHYRIIIMPLPPSYWPAQVRRYQSVTIVAVDPRSTKEEIVTWGAANLTVEELNCSRAAYGQPPVGQYLHDHWMTDEPFPDVVPEPVRCEVLEVSAQRRR